MESDLRERLARRLAELHGAADTTREPLYGDDADAVLAVLAEHGERIAVFRCPKCGAISERDIHCYVKGPPLFPQMDDYTICKRVEGVFVESHAE